MSACQLVQRSHSHRPYLVDPEVGLVVVLVVVLFLVDLALVDLALVDLAEAHGEVHAGDRVQEVPCL